MAPRYTASLSKNRNRESWAIIFRHPVRKAKDGKAGLRIRRGLGKSNKEEAQQLVDQMNVLLADESYWTPAAKVRAEKLFDASIVSAFYDSMEPKHHDHLQNREDLIHLPSREEGYARAMCNGTTGAGKTTLVRQFIGTDSTTERFPSTSAAKTTTCDIEIVLREGPHYEAAVSFLPRELVRQYIEECVTSAVIAEADAKSSEEIIRFFLTHREQRFRLRYILGSPAVSKSDEDLISDEEELEDELIEEEDAPSEDSDPTLVSPEEREQLEEKLASYLSSISALASLTTKLREEVKKELGDEETSAADREAFEELVEERLQEQETFTGLIDELLDDVESRFDFVKEGSFNRETSGWPLTWYYKSTDRPTFLRLVNRFSSNYAGYFGRLLTPIVQGMRVAGAFSPTWYNGNIPPLVLIDGEGLGHTPESTTSLPTEVTRRFDLVDAIIIVDNATQPLQAAPSAALRSVATRGHESKLLLVFTHFEEVKGDNLPNGRARKDHVLSSLDNCLTKLGQSLEGVERSLRKHLSTHTFFLSGIQKSIPDNARLTKKEISDLLEAILSMTTPLGQREVEPVYDEAHLVISIHKATQHFHDSWNAILGLERKQGVQKEHWARVKALSRRYAERMDDQYLWLRPVADISQFLSDHIRTFLASPLRWKPSNATEDEKIAAIQRGAQEINKRIQEYASKRLYINPIQEWSGAYYSRSGAGSTFWRARDIQSIYMEQTPIPTESPTPGSNAFLRAILNLLREGIQAAGGHILQQ